MVGSKVFTLVSQFSKAEQSRFRKFLKSPWFNEHKEPLLLYECLLKAARKPEGQEKLLAPDKIWPAVYPKRKFNALQLRRLLADLNRLATQFVVEQSRQEQKMDEALKLQKAIKKPELKKHLASADRKARSRLEEMPGKSSEYYLAQYQMHWNLFLRSTKEVSTAGFVENLIPAHDALERFYAVQQLKMHITSLTFKRFRKEIPEIKLPLGLWERLEDEMFQDVPLVVIYKFMVRFLTDPDNEEAFVNLIVYLDLVSGQLSDDDQRECYQVAQNYCALKINQGNTGYYKVYFDIFKRLVEKNLLIENNLLPEGLFKNIITSSLGVGEFEWATSFVQAYSQYLPAPIRENARTYNLAYIYFHLKKHDKVIELLRNVEYSDVVYALGAKNMLLRTYYECDEIMALDSLLDSFRIFVRRNKLITKEVKREYINFINYVKKLSTLSTASKGSLAAFKQKVQDTRSLTSKKWLLEKIAELE